VPVFCQRGFACGETARPVIGPAFWVCRAKSGAAFRCAKPPCAVVRFAAMTSSPRTDVLACPAFALLSHSPTALLNTPALVAIRLHFAARNRAGRSLPPPGATCSLPHFRYPIFASLKCGPAYSRGVCRGTFLYSTAGPALAPRRSSAYASVSPAAKPRVRSSAPPGPMFWPTPLSLRSSVAPRPTTRRLSPFGSISLCETALAGRCPRRGQRARYPIFASLKCGPALAPRRKRQRPHRLRLYLQRLKRYRLHRGQLLRPAVWPG